MKIDACPACETPAPSPDFKAIVDAELQGDFNVARCRECGFGWTDPCLPDAEIGRYYPQSYYGKENVRFHWALEFLVRMFRLRRARVIRRRLALGKVLDVGCGRGAILGHLKKLGYEPHGVEVSDHAAWHAKHRMGAEMYVGDFAEAPYKAGTFKGIIFWHSLEHFRKPFQALKKAHEILEPGGILAVAVPNSESWQARFSGRYWFHLDVPRHYYHFGTRSLRRSLDSLGFEILQEDHFSLEQNPYGWIQSFYNRAGFTFNLLYSAIKNRTSRLIPIRKHPFQFLFIAATLPALLPLSLVLTLLETVFRVGGTVEVYARKRKQIQ